jgi:predicted protein tyrosine phosphatase
LDISTVVISIRDPESSKADLKFNPLDAIFLAFDDVDHPVCLSPKRMCNPLTNEDARDIALFVNRWWGYVKLIIVNCEAGISRSAGVGAAILKYKTGDDIQIFGNQRYYPNRTCYRKVLTAFHFLEEKDQPL